MSKETSGEPKAHGTAAAGKPADMGDAGLTSSPTESASGSGSGEYVPLWNNVVTIVGMFLAAMAVMLLVTFALFSVITPASNQYVDIVGYLLLPGTLVLGLVLMPLGILIKSWRLRRMDPRQKLAFRFPRVNLEEPAQRRVAKVVVFGTFVFLPVVGVSSYHGYHYTDSSDFCARVCHEVMEPQATAFERSSHARVPCAECHIGGGASWFVKSKLSGTRQVLAVWRDSFSRPIPPAISELRPARETCEECHWPARFYGAQLRELVRFSSDETNTRHEVNMLLKTGGAGESAGRAHGIHRHVALAQRIEYVATDPVRQNIPWVRVTDDTGRVSVYRSDGRPGSDPMPEGELRQIDCMDCHNRPGHPFSAPHTAVDLYLQTGQIEATLPFIKREAVRALLVPYEDATTAEAGIEAALSGFYRVEHPDVHEARQADIEQAITSVREIYRRNFFPKMKVDWRTYPDNIGHFLFPGCFRCHEGRHVNDSGERISHDCAGCHDFLNPVKEEGETAYIKEGEFVHSHELAGVHAELRCDQCHGGGFIPLPTCDGCHMVQAEYIAGESEVFEAFDMMPDSMAGDVECEDCHDVSEPTSLEAIDEACLSCHDEEFEGMLASWSKEVEGRFRELTGRVDERGAAVLESLRQAGPLHNMEATRSILGALDRDAAESGTERQDDSRGGDPSPAP
jgi:hypothetical protein